MNEKELLYEITCLHSKQFYLGMKDTWDPYDFGLDMEYSFKIMQLENEYQITYGDLPDWGDSIHKVWAIQAELEKELNEVKNNGRTEIH